MPENSRQALGAELQHLTVTYSHLFLRAADAFLIWDNDGVIQNANGASCLLTGYDRDQLLGMDHRQLFPRDLHNMLDTLLLQSATETDGNILYEGEEEIRNLDGDRIPVTLRFITVQNPDGPSVLGIIHDIRDLKDLEARLALTQARYKGIVENVQEVIFLLNDDGEIIFFNSSAANLLGCNGDDLLGRRFRDLVVEGDRDRVEELFRGKAVRLDESGERPTLSLPDCHDAIHEFQYFISDIPDERRQPGGLLLVMHDITGEREVQEKLKHAERMQSVENILSKITHEVKNPLAAINASAEFLRRHWKVADETEKKEVIELIASETQRINSVITDYLRVRRVPNPTMLDYDIADLVDHVERALEQLLKERPEINLQTEVESRELPLDADMVKQVLFNLINNAIDALEEAGGDIVVKGYFQEETGFYELFIRDNGCGMSEETVKRAFEPFYTEKESGTGLGLPMVRQHIDALGGQLDLESEPGEGTTFTIRFAGSAEKENE